MPAPKVVAKIAKYKGAPTHTIRVKKDGKPAGVHIAERKAP